MYKEKKTLKYKAEVAADREYNHMKMLGRVFQILVEKITLMKKNS
jgi:hypothetical protein